MVDSMIEGGHACPRAWLFLRIGRLGDGLRGHHDTTGHPGLKSTTANSRERGSLRSQLLDRVAVLLILALLGLAVAMLAWLPRASSPQVILVTLLSLIAVDVALVLAYADYRLKHLVVRPIGRMVSQAEAIAAGKYDRRLERSGAAELQRLAESVNSMADRLIHHQEQLKHNVRSLHATNRELVLARRELVHAEKLAAVGRMAAGVAHEVGNPLGALIGYVEVAKRRGSGDGEWIEAVEEEAKRIDRVIRSLLDFSRPTRGQIKDFEVNAVIRETVQLLRRQGRLKTARVETDLELPGVHVTGDPLHLEQILVNLLLNADDAIREATTPGRITVRTATGLFRQARPQEPSRRQDDPDGIDYSHLRHHRSPRNPLARFDAGDRIVTIQVVDNGPGIPEVELEQVFEPFFTTKEPGRGTGLGLAVSARLAEALGGGMIADSTASEGTRFALVLPCARPQTESVPVEGVA